METRNSVSDISQYLLNGGMTSSWYWNQVIVNPRGEGELSKYRRTGNTWSDAAASASLLAAHSDSVASHCSDNTTIVVLSPNRVSELR